MGHRFSAYIIHIDIGFFRASTLTVANLVPIPNCVIITIRRTVIIVIIIIAITHE